MKEAVSYEIKDSMAIVWFDQPDSDLNVLNSQIMLAFSKIIDELSQSSCQGVMIASKKKGTFIAGADVKEIEGLTQPEQAVKKSQEGHTILNKLEELKVPTLAAINGACLGGGLELALACKYRTASFMEKNVIGLPEVNLGILPGFGGTKRLPARIGLKAGLELILAGKTINADRAFKIGLVDKLFPEAILIEESIKFLKEIIAGRKEKVLPRKKKPDLLTLFLEKTPLGQVVLFREARKNVLRLTKGQYPAPIKAWEVIRKSHRLSLARALELEREAFGQLAISEICKNLIQIFYLQNRYKKQRPIEDKELKPRAIKRAGLLGAGVMGGGIAQLLSFNDIQVRMKDINRQALGYGLKAAREVYNYAVKKRMVKRHALPLKMGLISPTLDYSGFKTVDIVIEAVVEDMKIKKQVFSELNGVVREDCLLVSNTSALSVTEMASVVKSPSRVAGLHFFNPVHRMPLVEVIYGEKTSPQTMLSVVSFSQRLGKVPIVVKDGCGFLVNRILIPYLVEAGFLLEQGNKMEELDQWVLDFGLPMGPFTLIDEIGLEVGYKVCKILEAGFGTRMKTPEAFEKIYQAKLYGKKIGQGFYIHKAKKKIPNPEISELITPRENPVSKEEALERLVYIMINEASRALEDEICKEPSDVDVGMIMGTGFPPFRGGLLRYADKIGAGRIVERLEEFREKYGEKYKASNLLIDLAKKGKGFYD